MVNTMWSLYKEWILHRKLVKILKSNNCLVKTNWHDLCHKSCPRCEFREFVNLLSIYGFRKTEAGTTKKIWFKPDHYICFSCSLIFDDSYKRYSVLEFLTLTDRTKLVSELLVQERTNLITEKERIEKRIQEIDEQTEFKALNYREPAQLNIGDK